MHERQRQVQTPLHAAGVAADLAVGRVGQPQPREQLGAPNCALLAGQAVQRGLQAHVLGAGEQRVEGRLLQGRPDHRAHARALAHDVVAGHARAARRGGQQRGEHQRGRRLARPVGPEKAVDLTGGDVEVDAVDSARALLELSH